MVAPTMETKEYTTRNGRTNFSPPRNSMQREPYKPHPIMVLNAKQHMANSIAQSVASSDAATAQSNFNGTRRKPRIARHPVRTVARIAAVTAVLAIVIGGAGTAMATGVLPLPSDMLSDIFDGPASQTEIIDRIGRPVGASCSNNGVTVTADAIMGDKDMVTIAYTLTFDDPAALKKLSEPGENGTIAGSVDGNVYVDGEHGGQGQSWLIDKNPNDSSIQYFAQFSVESPGLMGRTVRTHINSLVVPRAGKELPEYKKILTGPWDLKFQLNYEDTSVTIPAPKSVNFNGTKATIQEATVSCVGVSVRYNIDRSIEHDNNSGKMSQNMEESMDAVGNIPLIVTFKDGHVEDATSHSGYFANKLDNGTTDVHKTWPFSQVCDTDKIASVQIGDTVIPMNS